MVCSHEKCHDLRKGGVKHLHCPGNGRRLREAWTEAQNIAGDMKSLADSLTPAECDGDANVCTHMKNMLLKGASLCRLRCKYLGIVPWAFARADEVEGAIEVVRQMEATEIRLHDPLVQDIWRRLEGDIRRRAAGQDATKELLEEVKTINLASLDEGAGEGLHRSTNHEKTRAPGCKMVHLKGTARHKQDLAVCKSFLARWGDRGKDVFRYDWHHWKRIVQTKRRLRWRNKQARPKAVIKQVHREDYWGDDDWSAMASCLPAAEAPHTVKETPVEALRREWLVTKLEPNAVFSCT